MSASQDIIQKLEHYCAYQERCQYEVRSKLLSLKIYGEELEEVISLLIDKGFLNEERYSRAFARGKFRMLGWGKIKIKNELSKRKISEYCIHAALSEIEDSEYKKEIIKQIKKLNTQLTRLNIKVRYQKIYKNLLSKGFESSLIRLYLTEM